MLRYFSGIGVRVSLCSRAERAADSLDRDVVLLVVNDFDCAWPVNRWADTLAGAADEVPAVFVHESREIADRVAAGQVAEGDADAPYAHVTEARFRELCALGLPELRDRILAGEIPR